MGPPVAETATEHWAGGQTPAQAAFNTNYVVRHRFDGLWQAGTWVAWLGQVIQGVCGVYTHTAQHSPSRGRRCVQRTT
jgi:hypothetical protein